MKTTENNRDVRKFQAYPLQGSGTGKICIAARGRSVLSTSGKEGTRDWNAALVKRKHPDECKSPGIKI